MDRICIDEEKRGKNFKQGNIGMYVVDWQKEEIGIWKLQVKWNRIFMLETLISRVTGVWSQILKAFTTPLGNEGLTDRQKGNGTWIFSRETDAVKAIF